MMRPVCSAASRSALRSRLTCSQGAPGVLRGRPLAAPAGAVGSLPTRGREGRCGRFHWSQLSTGGARYTLRLTVADYPLARQEHTKRSDEADAARLTAGEVRRVEPSGC
jgi:hypothetical protein